MHMIVVLTMQDQRMAMCHLLSTIRSKKIATELLDAAIPIMQMPWPMASHMTALE